MHILIAPDSFKESLSAQEVAQAIQIGFSQALPDATFDLLPIGDGGEGTIASLISALRLTESYYQVTGPFGASVRMKYARHNETAFFEMADLVGLAKIPLDKRNPLAIETRGLGELLVYLAQQGVRQVFVGVGGSASHDGGVGMAAGLGYEFFDKDGHLLQAKGASLDRVARISSEKVPAIIKNLKVQVLADVTNPLCGENGATYIFAEQKGLSPFLFPQVDQAVRQFYERVETSILSLAGAGAGGGMAAGFVAFAGGEIVSGIDTCLDLLEFDKRVARAELVIVGEGRLDHQSLSGKAPIGVARRTPTGIPVVAICGSLSSDLPEFPVENIQAAFSIIPRCGSLEQCLNEAKENLIQTARNIGNVIHYYTMTQKKER